MSVTLSQALPRRLGEVELTTAVAARAALSGHGVPPDSDLLIVDPTSKKIVDIITQ